MEGIQKRLKVQDSLATCSCSRNIRVIDRMSRLPDDILISIISRLTLAEAIATGILSTRWRHLYLQIDRVVFPPRHLLTSYLDSNIGALALKEFRVSMSPYERKEIFPGMFLDRAFNEVKLRRCLDFAFTRKAEIIDFAVDLSYTRVSASISNLDTRSVARLKELSLSSVDVDDADLEFLLSNSPLLECLSVSNASSPRLRRVSIVGHPQLKLKRLEISDAKFLQSLEISDTINLVYLRCFKLGSKYDHFPLKLNSNIPNLTELSASHEGRHSPSLLHQIPSYIFSQLRLLKLHIDLFCTWEVLPELVNIKRLEVDLYIHCVDFPTSTLYRLVEACSSLEILEIKFVWQRELLDIMRIVKREICVETSWIRLSSPTIKKLKVSGYTGFRMETEIVLLVVKIAPNFDEFIIQLCNRTPKIQQRARLFASDYFRGIKPEPLIV